MSMFSFSPLLEQYNDLWRLAAKGDVEKLEQLLLFEDTPDVHDSRFNQTPLHLAAYYNRTEAAKLLLKNGANIEARNVYNLTPLHFAAKNNSTEVAKLLLERGAEIEAKNSHNAAPLHGAALNNSTEVANETITVTWSRNRIKDCIKSNTSRNRILERILEK